MGFDSVACPTTSASATVQQLVPRRHHRRISRQGQLSRHRSSPMISRLRRPLSDVDNYAASKSELGRLANAYVDLGTWWCMTPFIGAGVGAAHNTDHRLPRRRRLLTNVGADVVRSLVLRRGRSKGTSPGRCMPVSPTRSPATSPSNWPIATRHRRRGIHRQRHFLRRQQCRPVSPSSSATSPRRTCKLGVRWTCCSPPATPAAAGPQGLIEPLIS